MAAYIRMKTANTSYKIVVVFLLLVRNDGAVEKAFACYQFTPNFKLEGKAIVVVVLPYSGKSKIKTNKDEHEQLPFWRINILVWELFS